MQTIVLRQMLEMAQGQQPRPGEPRVPPGEHKPNPNPAQPPDVSPGINPDQNPPGSPFPPRNPIPPIRNRRRIVPTRTAH